MGEGGGTDQTTLFHKKQIGEPPKTAVTNNAQATGIDYYNIIIDNIDIKNNTNISGNKIKISAFPDFMRVLELSPVNYLKNVKNPRTTAHTSPIIPLAQLRIAPTRRPTTQLCTVVLTHCQVDPPDMPLIRFTPLTGMPDGSTVAPASLHDALM